MPLTVGRAPLADDVRPTRDGPAGLVLHRRLLDQRAELLRADRALRDGDAHGLHDLRVAMRRLRTALATFRPLVDDGVTDPLRDELRWASGELGRARDEEVVAERIAILLLEEPAALPQGEVAGLVSRHTGASHSDGATIMWNTLGSQRYASLLVDLEEVAARPPFTSAAAQPARRVVRRRLRRDRRRVLDRGVVALAVLDPAARTEAWHDVRKAAKRLRYAAEAAGPVTGRRARKLGRTAKRLQEVLGDHHDTVETRNTLRMLAAEAATDGQSSFTLGRMHALEQARSDELERRAHRLLRRLKQQRKP